MTPAEKQQAIRDLVDALCENRCDQADVERLESLLVNDEHAQWYYLRHMQLQAALGWDQSNLAQYNALKRLRERQSAPQPVTGQAHRPIATSPSKAEADLPSRRDRPPWWRGVALVTAASVALVVASSTAPTNRPTGAREPAIARIAHVKDARWTFHPFVGQPAGSSDHGSKLAAGLRPGTLQLSQGLLRVDFSNGASVTLEAPSVMTVVSGSQARLRHGRLTAKAPPEAAGFTIDSHRLKIVDFGTVFGVAVDKAGRGEVLVFDGQVELTLADPRRNRHDSPRRLLAEGVAAHVDPAQHTIEEILFNGEPFAQSWPITYGVLNATGVVKFVEPAPFINPSRYEDDDRLIVFPERESIDIQRDINVSIAAPGAYSGPFEQQMAILPGKRRLRSYLLQFNPVGRQLAAKRMAGSVTFDRPILGIICSNALLLESDADLGSEAFERLTRGGRGIEEGDSLALSEDRRTLTVDFTSIGASDQIRLLVDASQIGTSPTRTKKPVRNL